MPGAFRIWRRGFKMSKKIVSLKKVREMERQLVPKAKFHLARPPL